MTTIPGPNQSNHFPEPTPTLADLEAMLAAKVASMAALSEDEKVISDKKAAISKALLALDAEEQILKSRKMDLRRDRRGIEDKIAEAKRAAERERMNRENAERLAASLSEFDAITRECPWYTKAFDYQKYGAGLMANARRGILADGMGLGKTLQSLMWLDMVKSKRALVICPGNVINNFVREANKFTDRYVVKIGRVSKADREFGLKSASAILNRFNDDVVLVLNYEAWNRDRKTLAELVRFGFDSVILDEAHYVKETDGVPFRGVQRIITALNKCPNSDCGMLLSTDDNDNVTEECSGCGYNARDWRSGRPHRSVENLLCMSGTPVLNRPTELFSLLHLINPSMFPRLSQFIYDFCGYDENNKVTWATGGEAALAKKISGIYLRRTFDSVGIVLPPQTKQIHEIEFDAEMYPHQAKLMDQLQKHAAFEIAEGRVKTVAAMIALITRQRQAALWPGGIAITEPVYDEAGLPVFDAEGEMIVTKTPISLEYHESQKLDYAVDLVKELNDGGHRVVVFSQFKTAIQELTRRLGDSTVEFTGDTPDKERQVIKDDFDRGLSKEGKSHRWQNIAAHYRVGSEGINFTGATAMVILDEEWNAGKNEQAYARIRRIGQTEQTQVHVLRLLTASRIDEWMSKLISSKKTMAEGLSNKLDEATMFRDMLTGENFKRLEKLFPDSADEE